MIFLPAVVLLVTGCPREEYTVELTPQGDVIERKLTFFQADGSDANGAPNYQAVSTNELAAIARVYPPGGLVEKDNWLHVATGKFSGAMPADIGGAGSYTNYSGPLGHAAVYLERFRGDDDLATSTTRRLRAADKLTELVLGWSRAELGNEPRYNNLRTFLDQDFRRDVQNLGLYWWQSCLLSVSGTKNQEEFAARFGQYLLERGYLKLEDLPGLLKMLGANDNRFPSEWVRRLVMTKLGLPATEATPKSLAFLKDNDTMEASWEKYLATTDEYKHRLWKWRRQNFSAEYLNWSGLKKQIGGIFRAPSTNSPTKATAQPRPRPEAIAEELIQELFNGGTSGDNRLTVTIALTAPPLNTNGRWDEAARKVRWESNLAHAPGSEPEPAVFCYAAWSEPEAAFQKEHFGRVILKGDELMSYCLWRAGLAAPRIAEWDALMNSLRPQEEIKAKLDAFHFSDEAKIAPAAAGTQTPDSAEFGKRLIRDAVGN
jgi:hypothetical protein